MRTERSTIATIFGQQGNADQFGPEGDAMVMERVGNLVWLRKKIEDADTAFSRFGIIVEALR